MEEEDEQSTDVDKEQGSDHIYTRDPACSAAAKTIREVEAKVRSFEAK